MIEPHGLLVKTPVWYILSLDVEKAEPRTFCMNRTPIARPATANEVAFAAVVGATAVAVSRVVSVPHEASR